MFQVNGLTVAIPDPRRVETLLPLESSHPDRADRYQLRESTSTGFDVAGDQPSLAKHRQSDCYERVSGSAAFQTSGHVREMSAKCPLVADCSRFRSCISGLFRSWGMTGFGAVLDLPANLSP